MGVKRKVIKNTKLLTPKYEEKLMPQIDELRLNLRQAIDAKKSIIYLDEVMFTNSSILKVEYSAKYTNIEVDYKRFNLKTTAVIAAISKEDGLTLFKCYDKSIDREKYIDFIKELRRKIGNRRSTLFVDNLRVHKCNECLNTCRDQEFDVIFNTPYSPQFMPIELVFSQVKRVFKQLKTN